MGRKTQTAVAFLASEIFEVKIVQGTTDSTLKMLDKRQRITEAKVARLSEKDEKEQREKVETCLDMKGLWLHNQKRYATKEERGATFFWMSDFIGMRRTKFTQSHGPPNKRTISAKTRLTFETVEDLKEWKQFINHMSPSKAWFRLREKWGGVLGGLRPARPTPRALRTAPPEAGVCGRAQHLTRPSRPSKLSLPSPNNIQIRM